MKRMKWLIGLSLSGLCLAQPVSGQKVEDGAFGYYTDALRFSSLSPAYGTARMQAIGGANTALGGDITMSTANPAGLGFFNRSSWVITPGMIFNETDTEFSGETNNLFTGRFQLNTLGGVFNFLSKGDFTRDKFKGSMFSINIQKVNDFNNEFFYQGYNDNNSIIDYFTRQLKGVPKSDIGKGDLPALAYETYLVNPVEGEDGVYDSFVLGNPRQAETVKTSGSQYHWGFSAGGNYNDKLYFGAGLGFVSLKYKDHKTYREDEYFEESKEQYDSAIFSMDAVETLEISGLGTNANLGLIYRPIDILRIGISYTTPTLYNLTETSSSSMVVNYNNYYYAPMDKYLNEVSVDSDILESDYFMSTPGRLSMGLAVFAGKLGFVSADVELVNYHKARLQSSDFSVAADNKTIGNLYKPALNFQVGAEGRLGMFTIRGGYAYNDSPYRNNGPANTGGSHLISGGAGMRWNSFYLDLAVVRSNSSRIYSPYHVSGTGASPEVKVSTASTTGLLTLGFMLN